MALLRSLLVFVVVAVRTLAADTYDFQLNGKPVDARFVSLNGTPDVRGAGDVVSVAGFTFVVGPPGSYDLRQKENDDLRLYCVIGGKEVLLACRVEKDYSAGKGQLKERPTINPLEGLDPEALSQVCGVEVGTWDARLTGRLAKLDLTHCVLAFGLIDWDEGGFSLAEIPRQIRYLSIRQSGSGDGPKNLSAIGTFGDLRVVQYFSMAPDFDLGVFRSLPNLRHLEVAGRLSHADALKDLSALRTLKLGSVEKMPDLAFLRPMRELRLLDISRCGVEDLAALADLPNLVSVDAEYCPLKRLPDCGIASLKEMRLMGSAIDEKSADAFQKLNPQCDVRYDWQATLQKALAGADRVRVIMDEFKPGQPQTTKLLAEEKNADAIAELVGAFVIDEDRAPFHCMCDGSPWIEFYREDRRLTTIAVQHGFGIRWSAGWPGDRQLIARGQDTMTEWLARRGVKGPKTELAGKRERDRSEARRMEVMQAIVPAKVLEALNKADSEESAAAAFTKNMPDKREFAEVCFRLFGGDYGSWSHADQLDDLLKGVLLPEVAPATLMALKLEPHLQLVNGLGRWLFFERKWENWKADELEKVLEVVATDGLTHPREGNRRKTLIALGGIGTPTARKLLRAMLRGELPVRALPEEAEAEAGGMVTYTPEPEIPGKCSDKGHAAIWLARLNDAESKAELQSLRPKLEGEERAALEGALSGKKPGK